MTTPGVVAKVRPYPINTATSEISQGYGRDNDLDGAATYLTGPDGEDNMPGGAFCPTQCEVLYGGERSEQPALSEKQRMALEHPDEAYALNAISWITSNKAMANPFSAFLVETGQAPRERIPEYARASTRASAQIWRIIAERATKQADKEGIVLHPLLSAVIGAVFHEHWSQPDEFIAPMLLPADSPEKPDTPVHQDAWGPGVLGAVERLEEWISKTSDATQLEYLLRSTQEKLWPLIALKSPALASERGALKLAGIIEDNLRLSLANPNLTQEGAAVAAEVAINELLDYSRVDHDCRHFFSQFARLGFHLSAGQILRLQVTAAGGLDDTLDRLAFVPDAVKDEYISARIGSNDDRTRRDMLQASQGRDWVKRARELVGDARNATRTSKYGTPYANPVFAAIRTADEWNLKGVKREDLLFLLESTAGEARSTGLEMIARLTGGREHQESDEHLAAHCLA